MDLNSARVRVIFGIAGSLVLLLLLLVGYRSNGTPLSLVSGSTRSALQHDDLLQDASNQTLGFQKIFVINLPSRSDHRDAISLAAALTPGGLDIEYIDGVTEVDPKALPPGGNEEKKRLVKGWVKAWRAHVNVLQKIVEENITSALILEGDVDWDLRIKSQMMDFARASRLTLQPGREDDLFDVHEEPVTLPRTSPYGDIEHWDLLWFGHCGAQFVEEDRQMHHGRVIIPNDVTAPEWQHFEHEWGTREVAKQYPNHTRVVHRSRMNVCSLSYGMSQLGARRFLYELGVRRLSRPLDIMLRELCDGLDGRPLHNCLTVQPPLFEHHVPVGAIGSLSTANERKTNKFNPIAFTKNIRWSTRVNFRKLADQQTDYIDLFRDGEPRDVARFKAVEHLEST